MNVTVMLGSLGGAPRRPGTTHSPPRSAPRSISLPRDGHRRCCRSKPLLRARGAGVVGLGIRRRRRARGRDDALPRLRSQQISRCPPSRPDRSMMLLGGEPFAEQIVMWWNFVGRRRARRSPPPASEWMAGERFGTVADAGDPLAAPPLPPGTLKPGGATLTGHLLWRRWTFWPEFVPPVVRIKVISRRAGRAIAGQRVSRAPGVWRVLQLVGQDLGDIGHRPHVQGFEHLGRHVVQVGLIALRHEDGLEPGPLRSEQLLLHPTDRQHPAVQRDLAGHSRASARTGTTGGQRRQRGHHRDAGRRPVLGHRPGRHVQVDHPAPATLAPSRP